MRANKAESSGDQDPVALADEMLKKATNRTISPSSEGMEASPGLSPGAGTSLEGQLGPDELPAPEEVILNNQVKLAH